MVLGLPPRVWREGVPVVPPLRFQVALVQEPPRCDAGRKDLEVTMQGRMSMLQEKARTRGLTDQEADELGRLLAEAEGRTYSNAQDLRALMAGSNGGNAMPPGRRPSRWLPWRDHRRPFARTRSLEIGQAGAPPEDAERQNEAHKAA